MWMLQKFFDDKWTLVQVMTWWQTIAWTNVNQVLLCCMSSLNFNESALVHVYEYFIIN